VYKSHNIYESWSERGPKGARYTCSPSGWFDTCSFEDCFQQILLPGVLHLEGKEILIGDNLSSHISLKVIQLCRDNNIEFICLPPNSTVPTSHSRLMLAFWPYEDGLAGDASAGQGLERLLWLSMRANGFWQK
jgi:hypothetical protein